MLNYKGYSASYQYEAEDNLFLGQVLGIDHQIVFEGQTEEEAKESFRHSVDNYLGYCKKNNIVPQYPKLEKVSIKLPKFCFEKANQKAKQLGESVDQFFLDAIQKVL